jgi:MFS family permease
MSAAVAGGGEAAAVTVTADRPVTTGPADPVRDAIQRRTLRLLFGTQIVGGVGNTIGISVGALLAARLGGVGVSGLGQSCVVVGAALLAVPISRLMAARGRRPGLVLAYVVGAVGAVLVVTAAQTRTLALYFPGMALFGGGTAANLQARYAAVDLAPPASRARQLSVIVWATTIGAVVAPNLVNLTDRAVRRFGLPELTGPFVFGALAFGVVALVLTALLRPDPLLTARDSAPVVDPTGGPAPARSARMRDAVRFVSGVPAARLGIGAIAVGHAVMVSVMSMTPVHLRDMVHGDLLTIVGVVISVHIVGMYAFAPLVGLAADRLGRRATILGGLGLLLCACAVAGTAGHSTVRLTAGLLLLGLGWSGTMIGGSTLVTDATPVHRRPAVQGLSDLCMGLAGACGAALAGLVVELSGYPTLTLLAAVATVPLLGLALRRPAAVVRA